MAISKIKKEILYRKFNSNTLVASDYTTSDNIYTYQGGMSASQRPAVLILKKIPISLKVVLEYKILSLHEEGSYPKEAIFPYFYNKKQKDLKFSSGAFLTNYGYATDTGRYTANVSHGSVNDIIGICLDFSNPSNPIYLWYVNGVISASFNILGINLQNIKFYQISFDGWDISLTREVHSGSPEWPLVYSYPEGYKSLYDIESYYPDTENCFILD